MNAAWSYFWPVFTAGLLVGAICGLVAFRRRSKRNIALAIGLAISLAIAGLWHGPLGAADRFVGQVERNARTALNYNEIPQVTAHLHRSPLTRRLALSGPADNFQRSELVRIMDRLPGVSSASWSGADGGVPLIAEACIVAAVGFLLGLLLAYLVELRRRYNAQWKW
jgi:predicted histidine transporter YuiF (NhaC family)